MADEDSAFHHPVSLFGRDGAHENLLFKKPILRIRTFRHLNDKRVLLTAPLPNRRILIHPNRTIERAHDLPIVFIHKHESPTEVLVSARTRARHWCCCFGHPCRWR